MSSTLNIDIQPKGWALASVSDVGHVQLGLQKSASRQTGRWRTKYLRTANIKWGSLDLNEVMEMDFTPAERMMYQLQPGDVVLVDASGSAGEVGRAAIWRGELPLCCFQNHVIRFRPHAAVAEFALAVFRHYARSGDFARVARGMGIQHLGAQRFAQMPFPLPPLPEQARIATELEQRLAQLQEAESSLRSALRRTEQQVYEILAAAVAGNLVPSEASLARAEGRSYRDAAALLSLGAGVSGEQTSLLQDEEFQDGRAPNRAPLPEGWAWARVRDLGEVRIGRQLTPEQRRGPNQRKYLRVANVFEDRIDTADVKTMSFTPEEFSTYRLEPGDILLNEGQSLELVGRPAIFRGEVEDVCFQNTLIRFRAMPGIDPEYALIVFRHYLHSGEFQKIARRSTNIAHLGLSRFASLWFPLPPEAEQTRIAQEARRRMDASYAQAESVRAALVRLGEIERELLNAAVTGLLVPQDEGEEPAAALLQRLGPPPSPARETRDMQLEERSTQMDPTTEDEGGIRPLLDVLREAGEPLTAAELFARANYNPDHVSQVEQFYLALRNDRNAIEVVEGSGENAKLGVRRAS